MANIDNIQSIDKESIGKKTATKILIITSVDNDEILPYLPSTANTETVVFNLNEQNLFDTRLISNINNNSKRNLNQLNDEKTLNDKSIKRRKADLTCVICGGHASGYNFDQISCESCKAFFRRNALHPIEKTKCLSTKLNCDIRYDIKHKCQRCRLIKCFQFGMRKDFILTPEAKLSKQKCLEENRRISTMKIDDIKIENIDQQSPITYTKYEPINDISSYHLNETDWTCLYEIQNAYLFALQSSPSASSVISFELSPDKMSAYMNTLDIQNFAAVKLINFIRQIKEFQQLYESDRLILVKSNLTLLFCIHGALSFDTTREILYDPNINNSVSPTDEAFAQHCKSLYILCYGYEFNRLFMSILRTVVDLVEKDPIILQLLMLNMIFLKGLSANDDKEPLLIDNQRVFYAHSKYVDLLFRYLINRSSFDIAIIKMMRITEVLIKIQRLIGDFHQYIKSNIDVNYVNPLMKSLLHLT